LIDEDRIERPPRDCDLPRVTRHSTAEIRACLRTARTIWCAGCTNGIVTRALIDAILSLGVDHEKLAVIAGIGCAGRITQYLEFSTVHTAHGRALAVATGAKLADPSLEVLVVMGDGDCAAIGGNHFIHAARRNVDLTAVVFNNLTYGMTGGQMGPTTHQGDLSKTSPFGNPEPAFDICELGHAAGATYVARGTPYGYLQLVRLLAGGLSHRGFALVEVMSSCPTHYGRMNVSADPVELMRVQQNQAVPLEKYSTGTAARPEHYPVGVLHHVERPEFADAYEEVRHRSEQAL
jgi:2-oxoglutarate/2-oxoacid ferredoxin oxidoreductase subunit beta